MMLHEYTDGGDAFLMVVPARDRYSCVMACEDIHDCVAVTALTKHYGIECRLYWGTEFLPQENLNWLEHPQTWTKKCEIGMYIS